VHGAVGSAQTNLIYNGGFEEVYEVTEQVLERNGEWKVNAKYNAAQPIFLMPRKKKDEMGEGPGWWTRRREGYAIHIDQEKRHSGRYSVTIRNVDPCRITDASVCWGRIPVEPDRVYSICGWVRARDTTHVSVLYFLRTEGGETLLFSKFLGEDTFDWTPFRIRIDTSEERLWQKAKALFFRLENKGEGQVWFDDISLTVEPVRG